MIHQPAREPRASQFEGVPDRGNMSVLKIEELEREGGRKCHRYTPSHAYPSPTHTLQAGLALRKATRVGASLQGPAAPGPPAPTIRNLKLLGALGPATPGTAFPKGGGRGAPQAPPPPQPPAPVAQGQGGGGEGLRGGWGRSPRPLCAAPRAFALRLLPARPGSGGGEGRARQPGREGRSGRAPVTPSPLSPPGEGGGEHGDPGVRDPEEGAREMESEGRSGESEGWPGEERARRQLRLEPRCPGCQPRGPGGSEARRRHAGREKRRESPETEGAPSTLSRGIRSPRR